MAAPTTRWRAAHSACRLTGGTHRTANCSPGTLRAYSRHPEHRRHVRLKRHTHQVARHTLPLGKAWIENLTRLGKALGYRVEEEFDVAQPGQEPAPVDLAWLRSAQDRFPLFIIEVETRPSGQMTYNAAKVFSQDTDLFEKPLFLFHLVLAGGQTSGRLQTATSMFGQFN